jgi:mRNA interferase HicA
MKRSKLIKYLTKYGCHLKREGSSHSIWINPENGVTETIPRHTEIPDLLVKKIIKNFELPSMK